jgi:hypothetical protein
LSRSQDFVYVVDKVCIPYMKDTCSETKSYVMGVARASTIHLNGRMKEQTKFATIEMISKLLIWVTRQTTKYNT